MSTLADPQPRASRQARGRGNSKMTPAERDRANEAWRRQLARAERIDRLYRVP